MHTRYCTDCRKTFAGASPSPPYAAMTVLLDDGTLKHVDPISHEELAVLEEDP